MAWIGVEMASLNQLSPSGAPRSLIPHGRLCMVAMVSVMAKYAGRRWIEVFTRTRIWSTGAMHGDSTQAPSGEQAVQTGAGGGRGPSQELLESDGALAGSRVTERTNKGCVRGTLRQVRQSKRGGPGIQRTSVHG